MVRHHAVFASLQLTASLLALAWAGTILLNYLDLKGSLDGIDFLKLQETGTTTILFWIVGNGIYAVFAFITSLLIGNRHPDGWAVGIFSLFILIAVNGYLAWLSIKENGSWYIVVPVTAILLLCQIAVAFYRRRPAAGL